MIKKILIFLVTISLPVSLFSAATIWGLSGAIEVPLPRIQSGYSYSILGNTKSYNYNQTLGNFAEMSVIKSNDPDSVNDKIRYNAKLRIMAEGMALPSIALGGYNLNMNAQDRIFFLTVEKNLFMTGTSFFGGMTRDSDGNSKAFYGIKQNFFSYFSILAENFRNKYNVGLRITPFRGVNIDVFLMDIENSNNSSKLNYNFSIMSGF